MRLTPQRRRRHRALFRAHVVPILLWTSLVAGFTIMTTLAVMLLSLGERVTWTLRK
jgi:hypothetical protein